MRFMAITVVLLGLMGVFSTGCGGMEKCMQSCYKDNCTQEEIDASTCAKKAPVIECIEACKPKK